MTKSVNHHHHHRQRRRRRGSSIQSMFGGRFRGESTYTKSFGLKSKSFSPENDNPKDGTDPEEERKSAARDPDPLDPRPDLDSCFQSGPRPDDLEMVKVSQPERSAADDVDDVTKSSSCYRCNVSCWRHVIAVLRNDGRRERSGRKSENESDRIRKNKNKNRNKKNASRDDRSLQMTITLILVSTIYVVVFLPVLVHFLLWKLERSKVIAVSPVAMQIAQNYTRTLYVAGFAVNFFLYTISGRTFREQLKTVLCRRRTGVASSTGNRCRPKV